MSLLVTLPPLVHEGQALYHVASGESSQSAASVVESFHQEHEQPLF